jgi:hypothetical protein
MMVFVLGIVGGFARFEGKRAIFSLLILRERF